MGNAIRDTTEHPGPARRPEARLVVLSGPAGVGKNTVAKRLCREIPLRRALTATTRRPRPGEVDGRDYLFLPEAEFRRRVGQGLFLEHANVYGHLYGTPRAQVDQAREDGTSCLLIIDVQGAMQVKEACPDALFIFLDAPDMATLAERLRKRGTENETECRQRLATAALERQHKDRYDYCVVNDDLDRTVAELRHIVTGGRRTRR